MELFLNRFLFLNQAYEDEVRKRDSGVNPSTQKLFDELAGREPTYSGRRLMSAYQSSSKSPCCLTIDYQLLNLCLRCPYISLAAIGGGGGGGGQ